MSDRTSLQCHIYRCPGKRAARKLAELVNDLALDWTDEPTPELDLARPYTAHEVPLGYGRELAAAIIEAAPKACFLLWEDPAYEWLGAFYAHVPSLGLFEGECDFSGQVVLGRAEIAKVIVEATQGVTARQGGTMLRRIRAAVDAAAGGPWTDDWRRAVARRERAAAAAARAAAAAERCRGLANAAAARMVLQANATTRACLLPGPEVLEVTARRWIARTGTGTWISDPASDGGGFLWTFVSGDAPAITAAAHELRSEGR